MSADRTDARRRWSAGILAFGLLVPWALPAAAEDRTIQVDPGLWRFTNSFSVQGMGQGREDTITECLTEETAQLDLQAVLSDMAGPDGNCTISNLVDRPGRVELNIACEASAGDVVMRSSGRMEYTYSRDAFDGGVEGIIEMQGQALPYTGRGTGTRIADCTKD